MKKKLFAILLSIVMVAGLLPATALATEPTVYDIWVDGVQVTSENKDNLFSGTVSYDPTTHTLSLNNATLDNDTLSDYGIKTTIPSTLKIRLTGTNSITRTDPGGGVGIYLNYSNSVEITGDGTLVINVIGKNYDGISTGADVKISDKAKVTINAEGGLGIAGRMVEIDGATVNSTGLYAGIDAHWLKIINGADVTLKATQDGRNGAYIWKDQEGNGGDIELAASKVKATSYYPGLYAAGDLTVNGGEVNCTSTADGAIWAKGNILIKGGAKVTTDGKSPMGGNGTFTVEEAEIDAKNTNENNTPAISDKCVPVIADGYHLNYAKAVDSEGTEIDLLSSGTQDFAKYKNVHFITKTVYPVSFVVTPDGLTNVVVKVNGQEVTGSVSLEAGTYPVEVTADNCKAYTGNITITPDTATHTQTIAMTYLPADYTKVDAAIAKANALNKDAYTNFTAVETAINAVVRDKNITEQDEVDAMAQAIENAITALVEKPTEAPTATPTATPTAAPSASPTAVPTATPTATPTAAPSASPTAVPTATPTATPTAAPSASPTAAPTATPTVKPTATPSASPTAAPTATPTVKPTATPSASPTAVPTATPTATPTAAPSASPTAVPTATPTVKPTATPTPAPKADPNNPKTGSSNLPVVFGSAALVLSGGALAAVLIYKKKRHEK
ncbi:hypothetical protein [Hominenteromicrobium sp.]|uniref:hypothetical protein n=1 Tax=Hominenteromicrobium sp. TaxID=3073581 RepID=UPI003AEFD223